MRFLGDIAILLGNIQFEEMIDRTGHNSISYAKRKNCKISYEICNSEKLPYLQDTTGFPMYKYRNIWFLAETMTFW